MSETRINNRVTTVANQTITGRKTFLAGSATSVPVTVKAAPGQTANLFEARDSNDAVMTVVSPKGAIASGSFSISPPADTAATYTAQFISLGAAKPVLKVMGAAGQTGSLTEWQNDSGTVVAKFFPSGTLATGGRIIAGDVTAAAPAQLVAVAGATTINAITARAATNQTAPIQEWQDSAGTVLSGVGNTGFIYAGAAQTTFMSAVNGRVQAQSLHPAVTPLTVKGAAAQTSNLQEWVNSAGTAVATVSSGGQLTAPSLGASHSFGPGGSVSGTVLSVTPHDGSWKPLVVRGAAAQVVSLIEAQNSAGSAVWNISADAVMGLTRTSVVPLTNDGYGYLYVDPGGNLLYKSSNGTVRTVAAG